MLKVKDVHSKAMTDLVWSSSNDYILTTSLDGCVCIWESVKTIGQLVKCVRKIDIGAPALCGRYHPINGNIIAVGTSRSNVVVYNVSTGIAIQTVKCDSPISALCFDKVGVNAYAGTARGTLYTIEITSSGNRVKELNRQQISRARKASSLLLLSFSFFLSAHLYSLSLSLDGRPSRVCHSLRCLSTA